MPNYPLVWNLRYAPAPQLERQLSDMKQAIQVYSTDKGCCSEVMDATQIKSHSHARKLGSLVDSESNNESTTGARCNYFK